MLLSQLSTQRQDLGPFALNTASDDRELLDVTLATLTRRMAKRKIAARYYTQAVHLAAFALPGYVGKVVARAGSITRAKTRRSLGKAKRG
jgi:spermidine synthase